MFPLARASSTSACFVVAFLSVCGVVSLYYPDKPSAPKTYADGLEKELGGPNAVPVTSIHLFHAMEADLRITANYFYLGSQGW